MAAWGYAAVAVPYVSLEAAWLYVATPRLYAPLFARVQNRRAWSARPLYQTAAAAAMAYSILTWGVVKFALGGDPGSSMTYTDAAWNGACLGLLVYGTYNLTNFVAFDAWSVYAAAIDTLWGACVLAAVSAAAKWSYRARIFS